MLTPAERADAAAAHAALAAPLSAPDPAAGVTGGVTSGVTGATGSGDNEPPPASLVDVPEAAWPLFLTGTELLRLLDAAVPGGCVVSDSALIFLLVVAAFGLAAVPDWH